MRKADAVTKQNRTLTLDHGLDQAWERLLEVQIPTGLVLPWARWVHQLPLDLWPDSLQIWKDLSVLILMKSSLEP